MKVRYIRAYTLLEILIALAIIGILAGFSIAFYNRYRINTYNNIALYDLRNLLEDELTYQAVYQSFVGFGVEDAENGKIVIGYFSHKLLSPDVRAVVKVSSEKNLANMCTKHTLGNRIYGYETDTGTIYYKKSQPGYALQDDDCPNATSEIDFKASEGWYPLN
jgi:prepilin-type N-terminal cleavage/methylation domain-containing protein